MRGDLQSIDLKSINETAEKLGLSPWTIRHWINERKIECVRLGRSIRIPASEISRLIESGTRKVVP